MRLSRFDGGLEAGAIQFDPSVLAGNLIGFDAWAVPHCLVPFAISFLYDSLTAGLLGAYIYESLVVLLHIAEYSFNRDATRFYPYAGAISALIQDPFLGLMGALLGILCASRYGPVTQRPPVLWGLLCLAVLGASAVLSEVLWEPPPSAGLFAILVVPLYVAPLLRRHWNKDIFEMIAVLSWGSILLNIGCLIAYTFSRELSSRSTTTNDTMTSTAYGIKAIGGSVEDVPFMNAILQTPMLWILILVFPAWKFLIANV